MRTILIILILFPISITAQSKYDIKRGILRGSTMIIPAIAASTHEVLLNKYPSFKRRFPRANDQFWNPAISWENKYNNHGWLQQKFPLITDGRHLTAGIRTTTLVFSTGYITIGQKRPWWHYAIDLGIGATFYGLTSNLMYDKFYK